MLVFGLAPHRPPWDSVKSSWTWDKLKHPSNTQLALERKLGGRQRNPEPAKWLHHAGKVNPIEEVGHDTCSWLFNCYVCMPACSEHATKDKASLDPRLERRPILSLSLSQHQRSVVYYSQSSCCFHLRMLSPYHQEDVVWISWMCAD